MIFHLCIFKLFVVVGYSNVRIRLASFSNVRRKNKVPAAIVVVTVREVVRDDGGWMMDAKRRPMQWSRGQQKIMAKGHLWCFVTIRIQERGNEKGGEPF